MNTPLRQNKPHPAIASHLALLLTTAIWASTFINIKVVMLQVQPNTLAFLRFFLASIVLGLTIIIKGQSLVPKEDWTGVAVSGLTGVALYNVVQNQGLKYAGAIDSAILASLAPVFMVLLARLILKETITRRQLLGIVLAFTGSVLVATNGSFDFLRLETARLWGDFLLLLTGLIWGLYNISLKKLLKKYSAISVLTSSTLAGTVFLLPSLLMELPLNLGTVNAWGWIHIFYLGLFASALAYLLWNTALTRVSTVTAGAYLYLLPVLTAVFAFIFLQEIPGHFTVIGGMMALAGTYFASD